jgi:hypothetical protein
MTPHIKKNTTVSTDPDKHAKILMNIDMTFPNSPCFLMKMEVHTSVNQMEHKETSKNLEWGHIDKNGIIVASNFDDVDLNDEGKTTDLIKKFFDDGLKCKVVGKVELTKVTGQVQFKL